MKKPITEDAAILLSAIEQVVDRALDSHEGRCRIELLRFSGDADDVIRSPNNNAIFLRCRSERNVDEEGQPYEFVVRLAAVGGFWHIPSEPCDIAALVPEQTSMAPGVAFGLFVHGAPRSKLTQDQAFQEMGDASLASTGRAFAWRVTEGTQFGVDETGAFVVSLPNGTHISLDPATSTISLAVMDGSVLNNVLAALTLSPAGIKITTQSTSTGKKQIWDLGAATGNARMVGTGTFFATYPNGALGKTPTGFVGYGVGAGSLASATWTVSPV